MLASGFSVLLDRFMYLSLDGKVMVLILVGTLVRVLSGGRYGIWWLIKRLLAVWLLINVLDLFI